jgi:hypothetical protein
MYFSIGQEVASGQRAGQFSLGERRSSEREGSGIHFFGARRGYRPNLVSYSLRCLKI